MGIRGLAGAVLALALSATASEAGEASGALVGWVESTSGAPVPGAVISLFGKGLSGSGLVTLADSQGQFLWNSLPPGSYLLRAMGDGHRPAPVRRVTVLPNRESLFTVSLAPLGNLNADASDSDGALALERTQDASSPRELRWLLRHRKRSVLEADGFDATPPLEAQRGIGSVAPLAAWLGLAGAVEVLTLPTVTPSEGIESSPSGVGALQLTGRLPGGRFNVGGLVVDNSTHTTWRMAGEFESVPLGSHTLSARWAYGGTPLELPAVDLAPTDRDRRAMINNVGGLDFDDRWQIASGAAVVFGARQTYAGFLDDRYGIDPHVAIDWTPAGRTRIHGTFTLRTLVPGGDQFVVSPLEAQSGDLRLAGGGHAARLQRWALQADHALSGTQLTARAFHEHVEDPLAATFGVGGSHAVLFFNEGSVWNNGIAVGVAHQIGGIAVGSVSYTFGRSRREDVGLIDDNAREAGGEDFHDVVAQFDAFLDWSGTRLTAYYRVNTLSTDPAASARFPTRRYDLRLTQGIPFLESLTKADWNLLVAVRNLFYEADDNLGLLDEVAVANAPMRIQGGVAVRF